MLRLLLLIAAPFLVDAVVAYALAAGPEDRAVETRMVFFDWDQAGLSEHARATVAQAGLEASSGRATEIVLEAADGMGLATAYGAALSRARWGNLLAELARDGVPPEQIVRTGYSVVTLWPKRTLVAQADTTGQARRYSVGR